MKQNKSIQSEAYEMRVYDRLGRIDYAPTAYKNQYHSNLLRQNTRKICWEHSLKRIISKRHLPPPKKYTRKILVAEKVSPKSYNIPKLHVNLARRYFMERQKN